MKHHGCTNQPLVIIEGPEIFNIHSSYISVDEVVYKVDSPLRAVDSCFKLFHVLHAKYPPQSENIWLAIQKAFYEVHTPWDKMSPTVSSVVASLNLGS